MTKQQRQQWQHLWHEFIRLVPTLPLINPACRWITLIQTYRSQRGTSIVERPLENGWTIQRSEGQATVMDPSGRLWRCVGPVRNKRGWIRNAIYVKRIAAS